MQYPVEAVGALLSMGDCHGSQEDGESVATGVETSLTGKFRYPPLVTPCPTCAYSLHWCWHVSLPMLKFGRQRGSELLASVHSLTLSRHVMTSQVIWS